MCVCRHVELLIQELVVLVQRSPDHTGFVKVSCWVSASTQLWHRSTAILPVHPTV
jgi:hypothetical protein